MTVSKAEALDAALAQIDRAFGKGATGEMPALPTTMTERVARELCRIELIAMDLTGDRLREQIDLGWHRHVEGARSIFGIMCLPTAEMLDDVEASQDRDSYQDLLTAREQIEHIWQTMLTTAEYELDPDELARKERLAAADKAWRDAGCPDQGGDCPF